MILFRFCMYITCLLVFFQGNCFFFLIICTRQDISDILVKLTLTTNLPPCSFYNGDFKCKSGIFCSEKEHFVFSRIEHHKNKRECTAIRFPSSYLYQLLIFVGELYNHVFEGRGRGEFMYLNL